MLQQLLVGIHEEVAQQHFCPEPHSASLLHVPLEELLEVVELEVEPEVVEPEVEPEVVEPEVEPEVVVVEEPQIVGVIDGSFSV